MDLFGTLEATWPAAEVARGQGWVLRRGDGGGNRVSAASADGPDGDIAEAEAVLRSWGQRPLFSVRAGDEALDAALAARGYEAFDHSLLLAAPAAEMALLAPEDGAILCAGPLACMVELWGRHGTGPARLGIMERACAPKTWLMGRLGDRVAGCGFVAMHEGVAMLHSLTVDPDLRRRGLGALMTRAAARWALAQGGETLALAVTERNASARQLYEGLGLACAGRYHYRGAPVA